MRQEEILSTLAREYNRKRKISRRIFRQIIEELSRYIKERDLILDLGCGGGRILLSIAKTHPNSNFIGFDVSHAMLDSLTKSARMRKLANILAIKGDLNSPKWQEVLPKRKFDLIILFQSIHYINDLEKMSDDLYKILKQGGKIIVASTTHSQFLGLPYCLYFPKVLELELSRTPDLDKIIKIFSSRNFQTLHISDFKIKKRFKNSAEVRKWLLQKPFSALTLISKVDFENGLNRFTQNFTKEVLVDQFTVLTMGRKN